jgi:hypothetical protein
MLAEWYVDDACQRGKQTNNSPARRCTKNVATESSTGELFVGHRFQ